MTPTDEGVSRQASSTWILQRTARQAPKNLMNPSEPDEGAENEDREPDHAIHPAEAHFLDFLELEGSEVERLVVRLMVEQVSELRRLMGKHKVVAEGLKAVEDMMCNVVDCFARGVARCDSLGRLMVYGSLSAEPFDFGLEDELEKRLSELEPVIRRTVARALPGLLDMFPAQGELEL